MNPLDAKVPIWLMARMSDLAKIKDRRAELAGQRKAIEDEERELEIAEKVLVRLGRALPTSINASAPLMTPAVTSLSRDLTRASVSDVLMHILSTSATVWHTSSELQIEASRLKGKDVPMTTISPTLTALKKQNMVVRDGNKVAFAERARTNDRHDVQATAH
jgi:hypothetical protein